MREAPTFVTGLRVYVFFGDKLRKKMSFPYRLKSRVVEYKVDGIADGNVLLLQKKPVCKKTEPYGGCGLSLPKDDIHIISWVDFEFLRLIADDESIELYAKKCGYKVRQFKRALIPYRTSLP